MLGPGGRFRDIDPSDRAATARIRRRIRTQYQHRQSVAAARNGSHHGCGPGRGGGDSGGGRDRGVAARGGYRVGANRTTTGRHPTNVRRMIGDSMTANIYVEEALRTDEPNVNI